MQIDLSDDELLVLRDLFESANSDLREEIYKSEDSGYKQAPKAREQALQSLIAKAGP